MILPRLLLTASLACSAALAQAQDRELARFEALQQRIATACAQAPEGDLCQVYRHGVLQGVQAFSEQAESLSSDWGLAHERSLKGQFRGPRADVAWVARDVLNAVSCSPDPLDFVAGMVPGVDAAAQARNQVQRFCAPLWQVQRLQPWSPADVHMAVTQN